MATAKDGGKDVSLTHRPSVQSVAVCTELYNELKGYGPNTNW